MPWLHFHVSDKGIVKPCCIANINLGNINNQTFDEIWEGSAIKALRNKFEKGEPDKRCFVCTNREKSGVKSLREETFEKYSTTNYKNIKGPIYFDIRFSNVCNFKCRTCWHGASSKWFEDAKILNKQAYHKAIIKNVEDYDSFINKLGLNILNAREIYFAGGEPLVTEEHYKLLDFLLSNKKTNLLLRYNTNLSNFNFKNRNVLELWKKFDQVEILASIDDKELNGEYIRNGFNWNNFLMNREKLKGLKTVNFKISPTISILNVHKVTEFYKSLIKTRIIKENDFYVNILERPYHYNIKTLSEISKQEVKSNFLNFFKWCHENQLPNKVVEDFQSILDFMFKENLHEKYYNKFREETILLDKLWN